VKLRYRLAMAAAAAGLVLGAPAMTPALAAGTPLPAHVYAPYYETYLAPNTPSLTATLQASGARYFTLAFLQSTGKHSCSLDWNGNSSQPLNYYAADIAALRAVGGDVIPSFGGYSADQGLLQRGLDRRRLRVGDHDAGRDQARHGRRGQGAEQHSG
jgi:hypothetical protein